MKRYIPILFLLLSLALLLFASCVKGQPTETTAAESHSEELPDATDSATAAPTESATEAETEKALNGDPFVSDNEANYKDSWG
jgi:hypothetical protein